jgi:replication factor C small subunit
LSSITEILWVEKYRPRTLSDIVNQKEIVERLRKFVEEKNMPHLLFAGPAGTGKCVARDTPVLTTRGLTTIGKLVDGLSGSRRGFTRARVGVYSLRADGSIVRAQTSHVYKGVASRTILVELESGRYVETTPEHPLLTVGPHGVPEWIPADQVKPGYFIATPLMRPRRGREGISRLASLAGLLGSLEPAGSSGSVYCGERELVRRAARLVEELYGPKHARATVGPGVSCIEVSESASRDLGSRLGYKGEGVPTGLWGSPGGMSAYVESLLLGSLEDGGERVIRLPTWRAAVELLYALASAGIPARLSRDGGYFRVSIPVYADYPAQLEDLPWSPWIYWDRVARVSVSRGEKTVYDLTVPGHGNFVGGHGPLVLHNTTAAHALSHDLYGENYRQYVLELNASDERGINVIREKVKEFARSRSPAGIPFKIVILDEADNMTSDAQQVLRRLMELFSASTRFILIANYPSKIIDPIQSRCAYFRFQPLRKEDIVERLRYIAENENVDYDEEALDTIYEISEGDMRKAINILQSSAALGKVTVESVFRVVGMAKPKEVRDMIRLALNGDFSSARSMLRKLMVEYGLSGEDVVRQVHKEVMGPELKISDDLRVMIADYLGEIHYRMVEGSDEDIQLSAFLAWLAMLGKKAGGRG